MGVMRVNKTKNYTVMSNYHLSDKRISLRAKGLLSLMLSLPDDWNYSIAGLTKYAKDGKDAIMTILKELEDNNYLVRTQLTNDKGQFAGYDYDIYEVPHTEKPYTEKPNTDSPTLLNTNNTNINNNTNKLNTNIIKENIKEIYDYWQSKDIIKHDENTEKRKNAITKALKDYSVDKIKLAIDHYAEMYHSDYDYCNYKWSLEVFLGREKGFTEFLNDGSKWLNYLEWKNNPKPQYNNSKTVEKKELSEFEKNWFKEQDEKFWGKKQ